jgi:hypothetical protein
VPAKVERHPFLSIRQRDSPTSFDVPGEGRKAAISFHLDKGTVRRVLMYQEKGGLSIRQKDSYTSLMYPKSENLFGYKLKGDNLTVYLLFQFHFSMKAVQIQSTYSSR